MSALKRHNQATNRSWEGSIPSEAECTECYHPQYTSFKNEELDTLFEAALPEVLKVAIGGLDDFMVAFNSKFGKLSSPYEPMWHVITDSSSDASIAPIPSGLDGHHYEAVMTAAEQLACVSKKLIKLYEEGNELDTYENSCLCYVERLLEHISIVSRFPHNRKVLSHHLIIPSTMLLFEKTLIHLSFLQGLEKEELKHVPTIRESIQCQKIIKSIVLLWQQLLDPCYQFVHYLSTWKIKERSQEEVEYGSSQSIMLLKNIKEGISFFKFLPDTELKSDGDPAEIEEYFKVGYETLEELLTTLGTLLYQNPSEQDSFIHIKGPDLLVSLIGHKSFMDSDRVSAEGLEREFRLQIFAVRTIHMLMMCHDDIGNSVKVRDLKSLEFITDFISWTFKFWNILEMNEFSPRGLLSCQLVHSYIQRLNEPYRTRSHHKRLNQAVEDEPRFRLSQKLPMFYAQCPKPDISTKDIQQGNGWDYLCILFQILEGISDDLHNNQSDKCASSLSNPSSSPSAHHSTASGVISSPPATASVPITRRTSIASINSYVSDLFSGSKTLPPNTDVSQESTGSISKAYFKLRTKEGSFFSGTEVETIKDTPSSVSLGNHHASAALPHTPLSGANSNPTMVSEKVNEEMNTVFSSSNIRPTFGNRISQWRMTRLGQKSGQNDNDNSQMVSSDLLIISSVLAFFDTDLARENLGNNHEIQILVLKFLNRMIDKNRDVVLHLQELNWGQIMISDMFLNKQECLLNEFSSFDLAVLSTLKYSALQTKNFEKLELKILFDLLIFFKEKPTCTFHIANLIIEVLQYATLPTQQLMLSFSLPFINMSLNEAIKIEWDLKNEVTPDALTYLCLLLELFLNGSSQSAKGIFEHEPSLDFLLRCLSSQYYGSELRQWASRMIVELIHLNTNPDKKILIDFFGRLCLTIPSDFKNQGFKATIEILDLIAELCNCPHGSTIQLALVEVGIFTKVVSVLSNLETNSDLLLILLPSVFNCLTAVMSKNDECRTKFDEDVGYHFLEKSILVACEGIVSQDLVDVLLNMLTVESGDGTGEVSLTLQNTDVLFIILNLIDGMVPQVQKNMVEMLTSIVTYSYHNSTKASNAGIVSALLKLVAELAERDNVDYELLELIINLFENLGTHSISPSEMKLFFKLLRPDKENKMPIYFFRFQQALQRLSTQSGPLHCLTFNGQKKSGIILPPLTKLFQAHSGFTFHTWIRIEKGINNSESSFTRLFYFRSPSGQGIDCYISDSNTIVYSITNTGSEAPGKKKLLIFSKFKLEYKTWYCLAISHSHGRALFGNSEVRLYVSGKLVQKIPCNSPAFEEPMTKCSVGCQAFEDSEDGSTLYGQMGTVYLFSEVINSQIIEGIYELGPNYILSFNSIDAYKYTAKFENLFDGSLNSKLLINYNARSCIQDRLMNMAVGSVAHKTLFGKDASIRDDGLGTLYGYPCVTRSVGDSLNCLGGLQLLYLLIPQMNNKAIHKLMEEKDPVMVPIDHVTIHVATEEILKKMKIKSSAENDPDSTGHGSLLSMVPNFGGFFKNSVTDVSSEMLPIEIADQDSLSAPRIYAESPTAKFLVLLIDILKSNRALQDTLLHHDGLGVIGLLLTQSVLPRHFDVSTVYAICSLCELLFVEHHADRSTEIPSILEPMYRHLLLNFRLWMTTSFDTQKRVLEVFLTMLDNPQLFEYFRSNFGISFFLDTLVFYYWDNPSTYALGTESRLDHLSQEEVGLRQLKPHELVILRDHIIDIIYTYVKDGAAREEVDYILRFLFWSDDAGINGLLFDFISQVINSPMENHVKFVESFCNYQNGQLQYFYSFLLSKYLRIQTSSLNLIATLLVSDKLPEKYKKKLRLDNKWLFGIENTLMHQRLDFVVLRLLLEISCETRTDDFKDVKLTTSEIVLMVFRLMGSCPVLEDSSITKTFYLEILNYIMHILSTKKHDNISCILKNPSWQTYMLSVLYCEVGSETKNSAQQTVLDAVIDLLDIMLVKNINSDPSAFSSIPLIIHIVLSMDSLKICYRRAFVNDFLTKLLSTVSARVSKSSSDTQSAPFITNVYSLLMNVEEYLFFQNGRAGTICNESGSWSEYELGITLIEVCDSLNLWLKCSFTAGDFKSSSKNIPNGGPCRICFRIIGVLIKDSSSEICSRGISICRNMLAKISKQSYKHKRGEEFLNEYKKELVIILGRINESLHISVASENKNYQELFPLLSYLLTNFLMLFDFGDNLNHSKTMIDDNIAVEKKLFVLKSDSWLKCLSSIVTDTLDEVWSAEFDFFVPILTSRSETYANSLAIEKKELKKREGENLDVFQNNIISVKIQGIQKEKERFQKQISLHERQKESSMRNWRAMLHFFTSERGALGSTKETHWQLDRAETFQRSRPKLCQNFNFNDHSEASKRRDDGKLSQQPPLNSQSSKEKSDLDKIIAKQSIVMKETTEDMLDDEEWNIISRSLSGKQHATPDIESTLYTVDCDLVTLMSIIPGRLELTEKNIYFHASDETEEDDVFEVVENVQRDYKWPISDIREVHFRRYIYRRSALELFLIDQTNYFLNFDKKERNKVYSKLLALRPPNLIFSDSRSPADLFKHSNLTLRWQKREISNFEYLMYINTISGRTYNDLNQYPVFPWVLADYTSDTLDLKDPKIYRDLRKPIGALNEERLQIFKERYQEFEDPSGIIDKFHYGTHYSTAAGVLYYLLRVEPYTTLHIFLQSGKFDVADRQFSSIPATWDSVNNSTSDVKELIPEFFYLPDFLNNANQFDLGETQTGGAIDNVELPPWAKDANHFIRINREALESEYVSENLHHWIDLIFGYKQKGPAAVEACNVFYYATYEGAINLDAITDPAELASVEAQINNFGQTPCQVLTKPHPARFQLSELKEQGGLKKAARAMLTYMSPETPLYGKIFSGQALDAYFFKVYESFELASNRRSLYGLSKNYNPDSLEFVYIPKRQNMSIFQNTGVEKIVTVSKDARIASHSWTYKSQESIPFIFERDPTTAFQDKSKYVGRIFDHECSISHRAFDLSEDGKVIFSGGHLDNSLRMSHVDSAKHIQSVTFHTDIVTCVQLDRNGKIIICGSRDTTGTLWQVESGPSSNSISSVAGTPIHVLYGHDAEVTCVDINCEFDIAVTGSKDGTIIIHSVRSGRYIKTITPPLPSHCRPSLLPFVTEIYINREGCIFAATETTRPTFFKDYNGIYVFSCNGELIAQKSLGCKVNDIVSSADSRTFICACADGTVRFFEGLELTETLKFNLYVDVKSVMLMSTENYLLAGLADGKLIFITVKGN